MAVKWKWKNNGGAGSKDLEHRVDQLESELTPIQNNITTLQNEQTQTGNQLNTLNGEAVKISTNQTINGEKSFNDALRFPNRQAVLSNETNITAVKISNQNQKFIKFDFEQTSGGFQNYGWIQMNQKFLNNAWSEIFSIGFKNQDSGVNQGVWMNCSNNKFNFVNLTAVGNIKTPVSNNDAVNKQYVDAIKTKIKEIAAASSDFNDFKTRIGGW